MSYLVVALAAAATAASGPPASLEVHTPYGTVRGFVANHTRAFRGIPFALPPTGKNRFRPPQTPPARWAGVRDARAFGANCIQIGSPAVSGGAGHGAWDSLNVTDSSEVGWGGAAEGRDFPTITFRPIHPPLFPLSSFAPISDLQLAFPRPTWMECPPRALRLRECPHRSCCQHLATAD